MLEKNLAPPPLADGKAEPDAFGEIDRFSNTAEPNREQVAADLAAARAHLEKRAQSNRIISSWRDCLRQKIERANLTAELVGLSEQEHDDLRGEVDRFKRVCRALSSDPSGRRRG